MKSVREFTIVSTMFLNTLQLCDLMDGKYRDIVESFTVIDARYPYEYNGGHIKVRFIAVLCSGTSIIRHSAGAKIVSDYKGC